MARPALNTIEHGTEDWDLQVNENFDIITKGPAPIKNYADSTAMDAVNASQYDGCIAAVADDDLGLTLAVSDGVSKWLRMLTESGGSTHGAKGLFLVLEEEITLSSGASVAMSAPLPLGATLFGITARVTQAITGAAAFRITRDVSDIVASALDPSLGTTVQPEDAETDYPKFYPTAAPAIAIETEDADFTGGKIRVAMHYMKFAAPTS